MWCVTTLGLLSPVFAVVSLGVVHSAAEWRLLVYCPAVMRGVPVGGVVSVQKNQPGRASARWGRLLICVFMRPARSRVSLLALLTGLLLGDCSHCDVLQLLFSCAVVSWPLDLLRIFPNRRYIGPPLLGFCTSPLPDIGSLRSLDFRPLPLVLVGF